MAINSHFVTIEEAAEILEVSDETVWFLVREGLLPCEFALMEYSIKRQDVLDLKKRIEEE